MKLSINDILKLESNCDEFEGLDEELIENITGMFAGTWFTHDRVRIKEYMNDYCNDCRSRKVNIIFLDNVPTVFYQYVGKGEAKNIFFINDEKFKELRNLIIETYIKEECSTTCKKCESNDEIEIDLYGADECYIKDNKLISKYKRE